ncbi:MAG: hypothetical protein ACKOHM_08885 [Spartobacteria bacterium]
MKTDLWSVFLFPDSRCVAGVSLDRMAADAMRAIRERETLRPVVVISHHSSAKAADRQALQVGRMLGSGWFVARDSAVNEEAQMEGAE